jgi:hypothetical protein
VLHLHWILYRKQDRQCTYNVTLRHVRATIVAVEKQYYLFRLYVFVALDIQHAMRIRHIGICGLSGCTVFFPRYLIKGTIFEKKIIIKNVTEHKMCFGFIYNSGRNISHCERDMIKNVY